MFAFLSKISYFSVTLPKSIYRMKAKNYLGRRKFIRESSVLGLGVSLMPSFFSSGMKINNLSKPNIGLIGCGSRGMGLARILDSTSNINFISCCDIFPEKTNEVKKLDQNIEAFSEYEELISDKNIDGVVIATPLHLHFPMVKYALEAGKHVYVEKTMAYSIEETLEIEKLVNKYGKILQVGHQYRYFDMYYQIKKAIDEGWIGKVLHYESQYHRNADWRRPVPDPKLEKTINWRMYREFSGGLMAELAAHQIDVVNLLVGAPPMKVNGFGGIDYWKDGRETYDNVRAIYEYDGGIKSNVSSILTNGYNGYLIRILGTDGTMVVNRSKTTIYREPVTREIGTVDGVTGATIPMDSNTEGEVLEYDDGGKAPTEHALEQFSVSITEGKLPASNITTGKETAIAVHMANEAMRTETTQYWDKVVKL